MSESIVKTLKRDYAATHILPDTDTILALLPDWFEIVNPTRTQD